jgi:hypothetical protein
LIPNGNQIFVIKSLNAKKSSSKKKTNQYCLGREGFGLMLSINRQQTETAVTIKSVGAAAATITDIPERKKEVASHCDSFAHGFNQISGGKMAGLIRVLGQHQNRPCTA